MTIMTTMMISMKTTTTSLLRGMYLAHIQELLQVVILLEGPIGTPWYASSGASRKDVLTYVSINYSESSEDRNRIVSSNLYASNEYDYNSLGLGAGIVGLFNQKNTEVGAKVKAFFDQMETYISHRTP